MKKGWESKRLGDVCRIDRRQSRHKGLPYVGLEHIESGTGKFVGSLEPAQVKSNTFAFDAESVLFGRLRPYLKKVLLPSFQGHCSTEIFPLQPSPTLMAEYLHYWFLQDSVITAIDATCTGARMPRADMDAVMDFRMPVPPLPEQRRIVAILDEAFEGIAAAKANAERTLRNAKEVYQSATHFLLTHASTNAVKTTVGAEVELLAGFAFKSKDYTTSDDGVRLLRGDNIIPGGLRWEDVRRWPVAKAIDYERYALAKDDIVLAMDRPWVTAGLKRSRITKKDLPCFLVQRVARLRPLTGLDSGFLYHTMGTAQFIHHLLDGQTGTGVPHISGKQIADYAFAKPSLADQKRAAREIDALAEDVGRLEVMASDRLTALDELKASLLHQAFTGEL